MLGRQLYCRPFIVTADSAAAPQLLVERPTAIVRRLFAAGYFSW
jgi:hypothetical protein